VFGDPIALAPNGRTIEAQNSMFARQAG